MYFVGAAFCRPHNARMQITGGGQITGEGRQDAAPTKAPLWNPQMLAV